MAFFQAAKSALHACRSFTTTAHHASRTRLAGSSVLASGLPKRALEVAPCPPLFHPSSCHGVISRNQCHPFSIGAKRFYSLDPHQVRRPEHPRLLKLAALVLTRVVMRFLFFEVVPYTRRWHFVLIPKFLDRIIGDTLCRLAKACCQGKILPPTHPMSARVRLILEDIVKVQPRGLRNEKHTIEGSERGGYDTLTRPWEHFNWEVIVLNEPAVDSAYLPGGKIVVSTRLLEHFRRDAELATVIAHEVAHGVARYDSDIDIFVKIILFWFIEWILRMFAERDYVNKISSRYLLLSLKRKIITEADYIGLMLMASAGYDPRVALQTHDKADDGFPSYPSHKERRQLLAQPLVMEEALVLYQGVYGTYERGGWKP